MDEGTLGVEEIELVVKSAPGSRDGGSVGQHAKAASHLRQITTSDVCGWFIADTQLEASRAPVDELDRALRLDDRDGSVDVLRDDVTTVEEAARH